MYLLEGQYGYNILWSWLWRSHGLWSQLYHPSFSQFPFYTFFLKWIASFWIGPCNNHLSCHNHQVKQYGFLHQEKLPLQSSTYQTSAKSTDFLKKMYVTSESNLCFHLQFLQTLLLVAAIYALVFQHSPGSRRKVIPLVKLLHTHEDLTQVNIGSLFLGRAYNPHWAVPP